MTADTTRAALWMIGAICSFTLMAVAGREVSDQLDTFEIMLFRSLIGVVVVVAVGQYAGTLGQVNRDMFGLHLLRNVAHFTGQNLWFYAITVATFAEVIAIEFTSPIWILLLSPLLLGERITRHGALAAGLGFAGVLIVARPDTNNWDPGLIAAALAAIAFALTAIITRRLTRTQSITCIMFWLTVTQTVFGLVCAGYDGEITVPSVSNLPWMISVGFAGLAAHFCLTTALSLAPANVVMPMDFARLPVITLVGVALYNEPLEMWVFAGAALILLGNWINLTGGKRTKT